jgi:hypothetical protein
MEVALRGTEESRTGGSFRSRERKGDRRGKGISVISAVIGLKFIIVIDVVSRTQLPPNVGVQYPTPKAIFL